MALSAALGACNQQTVAPQPPATDGGYGPFGGDAAPMTTPQQQPMQSAESVIAGAATQAPPEFQGLITSYLNNHTGRMAAGWQQIPSVPDVITGLSTLQEHRWQVQLRAGQAYAFIGACDNECSDLDLYLENAAGGEVDTDVLPDNYPLVEITPPVDGIYTLRIQLKACSVEPCYVGARLVREP